jgi:DNA-binding transcriptional LysR family regulator
MSVSAASSFASTPFASFVKRRPASFCLMLLVDRSRSLVSNRASRRRHSGPTDLSQQILSRAVPVFMRRYPLIRLHIRVTNRPVSLVEDGIDVAVRARSRLKDEAVTMRKLRTSRLIFVASPAFNTSHSILREPKSLAKLPMLSFQEDAERPRW